MGATAFMLKVLELGPTPDPFIEGKLCKLNITFPLKDNIKQIYIKDLNLNGDTLWQIQVLGENDIEYLMLQSQLEPLEKLHFEPD